MEQAADDFPEFPNRVRELTAAGFESFGNNIQRLPDGFAAQLQIIGSGFAEG
jgi:hypothetical protein